MAIPERGAERSARMGGGSLQDPCRTFAGPLQNGGEERRGRLIPV